MSPKAAAILRAGAVAFWVMLVFAAVYWSIGALLLHKAGADWKSADRWTTLAYWTYHGANAAVRKAMTLGALLAAIGSVIGAVAIWRAPAPALYGNRRLATLREIRKAGLMGDRGIVIGRIGRRYLMFGGSQHVLLSAPTRSGKGVGVVIPNLLVWPDSVVVLDMKHENWEVTAGYRAAHGQAVYLFDPASKDGATHRYNPLDAISRDPKRRVTDIQKIANMVWPDGEGTDPFWYESARKLFLGLVLLCLETGKPVTLGEVFRQATSNDEAATHLGKEIATAENRGQKLSAACRNALNDFVSAPANTRGSIRMSFTAKLELWANPLVDLATSRSDFSFGDLRRKRMSIYLGVTPDAIGMMRPLINLLFQQAADANIADLPPDGRSPGRDHGLKHQVLLVLDEFANFGAMPTIANGITYLAGYNVRLLTVIQSPAQLREAYGKDRAQTMMENHALHLVFAPKDQDTAEELSRAIGYRTVKSASRSRALGLSHHHRSENLSDAQRALFLPQELKDIGDGKAIVTLDNLRPFLTTKIRYFADRRFERRLHPPPAVPMIDLTRELADLVAAAELRTADEVRREKARRTLAEREGAKPGQKRKSASEGSEDGNLAPGPDTASLRPLTPLEIADIDTIPMMDLDFGDTALPAPQASAADVQAFVDSYLDSVAGTRPGEAASRSMENTRELGNG